MSLSDYISIFDTRPIAQSHLYEAATATLCAIYTGYMSIYILHVRTYTRCRSLRNTNSGTYTTSSCMAWHGRHATPGHATPLRRAHPMLPAGPADADADSDAATAAACCLYRDCTHVRVCVYRRKVDYETSAMRTLLNILAPTCAIDGRNATPVGCQKLHWRYLSLSKRLERVC